MKVVIPMAGSGVRFTKAGFKAPKYKLTANGKPLIQWALESLADFTQHEFIFIAREETWDQRFISNICKRLNIDNFRLIKTANKTAGQASTVMLLQNSIPDNEAICIYNIDTHVSPYLINKQAIGTNDSGHIPLFKAEGDHWSFAKLNTDGEVVEVAEKRPISNNATIGFYYFSEWSIFCDTYRSYRENIIREYKETYIAPMYQYLINQGLKISSSIIPKDKIVALGTPEEVNTFDPSFQNSQQ